MRREVVEFVPEEQQRLVLPRRVINPAFVLADGAADAAVDIVDVVDAWLGGQSLSAQFISQVVGLEAAARAFAIEDPVKCIPSVLWNNVHLHAAGLVVGAYRARRKRHLFDIRAVEIQVPALAPTVLRPILAA